MATLVQQFAARFYGEIPDCPLRDLSSLSNLGRKIERGYRLATEAIWGTP